MLAQYVGRALLYAKYERLAYGWLGYISEFDDLWVMEETRVKCEEELGFALEHWLTTSYQQNLPLPVVDGIDLAAIWEQEGRPRLADQRQPRGG